jgi:hypothetical protein
MADLRQQLSEAEGRRDREQARLTRSGDKTARKSLKRAARAIGLRNAQPLEDDKLGLAGQLDVDGQLVPVLLESRGYARAERTGGGSRYEDRTAHVSIYRIYGEDDTRQKLGQITYESDTLFFGFGDTDIYYASGEGNRRAFDQADFLRQLYEQTRPQAQVETRPPLTALSDPALTLRPDSAPAISDLEL